MQTSDSRMIELIPLGLDVVPEGMALQFWTKGEQWQAPVSLGLVKPGEPYRVPLQSLPALEANQLFELTLEKSSGSPTGLPTGPVKFIGRAVKVI
jgi:anti-sigma-K factor RskA